MTIKRVLSFIVNTSISLGMIVLLVYFIINFTNSFFNMGRELGDSLTTELPDRVVTLSIAQGSNISDVAHLLEDEGIIRSALFFRIESILKGNRHIFDENQVTVNTDMSYNQLIFAFLEKTILAEDVIVTIPEGATVEEIAAQLEESGLVAAEDFIRAANESVFNFSFLADMPNASERRNRLEGYLFPDTYFIPENATAEAIIHQMLNRFEAIYNTYVEEALDKGFTMDEIIIMASIIEREIRIPAERELASQVMHNRLAENQRLEMCSTVLYVLGESRRVLLYEDLQVESYYNTYMYGGLPIGPISNPGEAAIKAVLHPSEGDFLFFVLMDENTGEHYFTSDYNDFLAAKERYNQ